MIETIKTGIIGAVAFISGLFGMTPEVPRDIVVPLPPVEQAAEETQLGAYTISGGGTYRLKSSISSTDTSVTLASFKEPVSDLKYSMSYLGTTIAYGTIDPQTTRSEFVSFTGITQNSDGSAILSGVTRGLTRTPGTSSCTASTTLAQRHPGQSIFILSDSPCHFAEYLVKKNDETITGTLTVPTPTAGGHATNKTYVDNLVNGGAVSTDSVTVTGMAGESFNQGQIIYFDNYVGRWLKASASNGSTTENQIFGIANGGGTNGVNVTNGILLYGVSTSTQGTTLTTGQVLYLSNTAGATSTSPGTNYLALGTARSTSIFYFDPHIHVSTTTNATTTNMFVSGNCIGCTKTYVSDFLVSGNWTKPVEADGTSKVEHVMVIAVGAGGSGAGGCDCTGNPAGGGGGGGAVNIKYLEADKLGSRVWVQVGTTTAAGTGGATATDGGNGTPSFFGTSTTAYYAFAGGGGGGRTNLQGRSDATGRYSGGAGGGWASSGNISSSTSLYAASTTAVSGQGVDGGIRGNPGEWGGGSGGGFASSTATSLGGCSLFAGGGGGGTTYQLGGSAGGGTGCYGTGGGGAGSSAPTTATAGSSATSTGVGTYAGSGGGGGGSGSNNVDSGGQGGAGGYPGGGGGGGGSTDPGGVGEGAAGGRGAPGWVRVISW